MAENFDPYTVLGVSRDAPDFIIEAAYRACLKRFHPDKYSGNDANERTAEVLKAYRLLKEKFNTGSTSTAGENNFNNSDHLKAEEESRAVDDDKNKKSVVRMNFIAFGGILAVVLLAALVENSSRSNGGGNYETISASDVATDVAVDNVKMPAEEPVSNISVTPLPNNIPASSVNTSTPISVLGGDTATHGTDEQLDYGQIESASSKLISTVKRSGMIGARIYSEACHKAAQGADSWSKNDFCAAFDFAAAALDRQMQALGSSPNQYFSFQYDSHRQYYYPRYQDSAARLNKIETAVNAKLKEVKDRDLIAP